MTANLNHKKNLKISPDKILFIIACTYLMMVIAWLASQGRLKFAGMGNSSNQASGQQKTLSPDDAKFIAYLQQSLEILQKKQQQQKANPQSNANSTGTQSIKIPSAPVPSNPPAVSTTTPRIIEKIYIPVYPQMQQPQPNTTSNSPSVIAVKPSSPTRLTVPPPPPLPLPSPASLQPPKPPSTVPVLTPGVSLIPNVSPSPSPSNISSNGTGTLLVGLLEAGDNSSALFTINGQTQRFQVGEGIGTSGWILKSVENQQAIVIRNGTVRYVGVGQSF